MLMESESKPRIHYQMPKGIEDTVLPEDLIFEEILPRLPVESLISFKHVSKKWFDYIINDERLAYNNLCHQSDTTKLSIILSDIHYRLGPQEYKMYVLDHHGNSVGFTDVSMFIDKFSGEFAMCHVVGSCNGLVCLNSVFPLIQPEPLVVLQSKGDALILWNPVTGELRDTVAPPLPPRFNVGRSAGDYPVYGFGYDECHNDYKVVRIFPTSPTLLNISMFSRNSGCWRQLDQGLLGYTVCGESSESVLLDGCLYWLLLALEVTDGGSNVIKRRCILSFSLCDEDFKIISVLNHHSPFVTAQFPSRQLVKWKNCLAYAWFPDSQPGQRNDFGFELILDSNGNVVVGQNASSIDRDFSWSGDPPSFSKGGRHWHFCGVSRDRFIVTEESDSSCSLVMYDPFDRDCESVGRREVFACRGFLSSAHDYVPSLVSVYANHTTMIGEKHKMEARYWVDMFWRSLGLTKSQFGLPLA